MLCLNQTLTPTLGPVTPTRFKTLEEVNRAEEVPAAKAAAVAEAIGETAQLLNIYLKEQGKMVVCSNSPLPKADIKPFNSRRLLMLYPFFCAYKNYRDINDIICTGANLLEAAFFPTFPDTTQWSHTYHVNIDAVGLTVAVDTTGARPTTSSMVQMIHIVDANLQK